ncbi:MAG: MMPL family transporter [Corynebacterium sp.]|nr:MMPL family transporter [Corynebacterium sp.]
MFYAWGRLSYRFRHIIPIVVTALIVASYVLFGTQLGDRMSQEGWDDPGSSSTLANQIELITFGRDNSGDVILLVRAPDGKTLDDPAIHSAATGFIEQIKTQHPDQIAQVASYFTTPNENLITEDKTTAFIAIGLSGDGEQTLRDFRTIQPDLLPGVAPESVIKALDAREPIPVGTLGGATVEVAGATAVADALDRGMSRDISRAEVVALPAVGLLLLLVFGSLIAAGMPLLVGVLSIAGSLGVLSLLAQITQVNTFAQSVVTLLGLGLAIDYGLFLVSRFREEMDAHEGEPGAEQLRDAVAITTATAGKTVVSSALMVAVAISGLFVFPQAFLKSIAYGAISAVMLAALLSITVLPSVFGLLGKKIDWLSVRLKAATDTSEKPWQNTVWARVSGWAMKWGKLTTLAITAILLGLTLPLGGVQFGGINETYLPPDNGVRQAQANFDAAFPALRTDPVKLVITGASPSQEIDIYEQANQIEGLTSRFNPVGTNGAGVTVFSAGITDRSLNGEVIAQLRALDVPDNARVFIGGTPALEVESIEALLHRLPLMALYIIAATFLLLSATFGSVILPAKAVIMNILGLGATLGILTAIFVDGVGASLLGFTPGPLMSPVLVLIVAIVYGLSTDYEVFLLSRMVEARGNGADTDTAIRYGTAHTGSIITAAAIIMIVVCGAFGFSEIVMMKYIAYGMIAALLLDATVIRMLLVPAVMHLLGDDAWWSPAWRTEEPVRVTDLMAKLGKD